MEYLSYKTFVWPHNPQVYREEYVRDPQYYTEDGVTLFDHMGDMKRVITGSGVFLGEDAVERFQALAELFESDAPGDLRHPVWGIRYCYFTGLELTQEPRDDCVSYKFEFTGALANGVVPR